MKKVLCGLVWLALGLSVQAKSYSEKIAEVLSLRGGDWTLLYGRSYWEAGGRIVCDPRDISVKKAPSGKWDVTIRLSPEYKGSKPDFSDAYPLFRGAYCVGFDWYMIPGYGLTPFWRCDGGLWDAVPASERHVVGLKGRIESVTVEFYEKTVKSAQYDALGHLVEERKVDVALLERWILLRKDAERVEWQNIPQSPSKETETALMELIKVEKPKKEE